jgi:hypothetical protein
MGDPWNKVPVIDTAAELCGGCHTDAHHPTYDEWTTSRHETASENAHNSSCNVCHSPVDNHGETEEHLSVECVACHEPHARTGNAEDPDGDQDYQLRFMQYVDRDPSFDLDVLLDRSNYGLCGQCHHTRGRTWDASSRGPHHSLQENMFRGEMPMPEGQENTPLVPTTDHQHPDSFRCERCHMYTAPYVSEDEPAITGHSWHVNYNACVTCHGDTPEEAQAEIEEYMEDIEAHLAALVVRMDNWAADHGPWGYSCCGGPPSGDACAEDPNCTFSQDDIPVEMQQVRFLLSFIEGDASSGVHNEDYTEDILAKMNQLLVSLGY